jgi:hypothetical protein
MWQLELKMTNPNPFTLPEIVSWFRSKRSVLKGSVVTLVDIRERTEYLPAAAADFDCGDTMGRINGWVSGDFDFEVVDPEGQNVFSGHVHASAVDELEPTYLEFVKHLQASNRPGGRSE